MPVDPHVKRRELASGVDIRSVPRLTLNAGSNPVVGDCLCYAFKGSIIIAKHVIEAMAENEMAIDPEVVLVPFDLVDSQPDNTIKQYFLLWPLRAWDCLDYCNSEIEFYKTKNNLIREVYRWCLNRSDIPSYDIFATDYCLQWFVSERFRQLIAGLGCTGFQFGDVKLSELDEG